MILCVSFLIFEGAANTMGVYFDNFLVGMLGIMNMWFASFLFSGIMVQENDVPWPLRVFMFIMPFKWSLSSLIYTEFHELTFRGSYYYSDLPTISTFINNTSSSSTGLFINTNSTMLSNTTTSTQSFYCPYVAPQQCYGPTGIDALNTLHSNWGTVSSQDNVGRNFGILIAMYVVYKFSFAMAVYMKATVAAHIQPHSKSISAEQESQRVQAIGLDIPVKIVDDIDNDSSFQLVASERERLLRQGDFVREFANPDINAEFIFENVFYEVADPKNKTEKNAVKQIIKGVSGGVKAGEILTIMGPSGAGKTTLLNLLTLEATTGQSYGSITLNGRELTRELFLQNCFYVPQYPALYAFLTPRETLMITARLFETKDKDGNTEEIIAKRVNTLLEVMGLQSCADIKIGNEFFLGLSGGQKKRLSVAVALLSRPLVLFLDEPTTGLDAAAAAGLMKLLQQLATSAKILVVATIHQPSDQVFANFDNIMLLARGEVAYQGPASRVAPYFQQIGYPMPDKATPAEYMLDLINDEFTSPERVASVVSAWSHHSTDVRLADRGASHLPRPIRGASMASQIILLLQRQSMLVVRDPMLYIGRMIAYLFANMFFCAVYYAARDRAQSRVIPRMFNDMWCIGTAASMALIIVFGQNREIHTIKNEVKNGMLSPFSYVIANTILQIPILFLMVIVGYLLPFYAVMLSNPDHLGEMIVIITVMLWSFEALAELLAVQYENFLIGMLMFLNFWFSSFLFSGVIAAESQVPWPLKIFLYISPLRYGLETMVYLDFVGDTYGDAQFSDQAPGYVCNNGRTGAACFGRSGSQVLRSLHSNFETMDDKNLVLRDVLICLLIGGAIKLLYVGMLWQKVTTVQLPKPSAGKVAQVMKTPKMNDDHKMETIATAAAATATATATAATIHIHASTVASHIAANKVEKHIDGAGADAVAVGVASPTPPDQAATTTTTTPTPTPAASLSTSTQTPIPATESFRVRNDSIESDADAVELDIISGAEQPNRHPSTHVVFHTIQQQ